MGALAEGAVFAGYRIVRTLGSGGMGEVYLFRTNAGGIGCGTTSSGPQVANSSLGPGSQDVVEQSVTEGELSGIADQVET
jgi:hypothetical protein